MSDRRVDVRVASRGGASQTTIGFDAFSPSTITLTAASGVCGTLGLSVGAGFGCGFGAAAVVVEDVVAVVASEEHPAAPTTVTTKSRHIRRWTRDIVGHSKRGRSSPMRVDEQADPAHGGRAREGPERNPGVLAASCEFAHRNERKDILSGRRYVFLSGLGWVSKPRHSHAVFTPQLRARPLHKITLPKVAGDKDFLTPSSGDRRLQIRIF